MPVGMALSSMVSHAHAQSAYSPHLINYSREDSSCICIICDDVILQYIATHDDNMIILFINDDDSNAPDSNSHGPDLLGLPGPFAGTHVTNVRIVFICMQGAHPIESWLGPEQLAACGLQSFNNGVNGSLCEATMPLSKIWASTIVPMLPYTFASMIFDQVRSQRT